MGANVFLAQDSNTESVHRDGGVETPNLDKRRKGKMLDCLDPGTTSEKAAKESEPFWSRVAGFNGCCMAHVGQVEASGPAQQRPSSEDLSLHCFYGAYKSGHLRI